MNPLPEQIDKMVKNKLYTCQLSLVEEQEYRDRLELSYNYDFLPRKNRIQIHELPIIPNFESIIKKRVERLNKWIEDNKSKLGA
jgi:hypothetical protein